MHIYIYVYVFVHAFQPTQRVGQHKCLGGVILIQASNAYQCIYFFLTNGNTFTSIGLASDLFGLVCHVCLDGGLWGLWSGVPCHSSLALSLSLSFYLSLSLTLSRFLSLALSLSLSLSRLLSLLLFLFLSLSLSLAGQHICFARLLSGGSNPRFWRLWSGVPCYGYQACTRG